MISAFVVRLDMPDASPDTIAGYAEHIKEALEDEGMSVSSVNPWSSPGATLGLPQVPTVTGDVQPPDSEPPSTPPAPQAAW